MRFHKLALAATAVGLVAAPISANAQDAWKANVVVSDPAFEMDNSKRELVPTNYESLNTADVSKKWHICLLEPHMKNAYWVSYTYGAVEEAMRQGVKLNVMSAGGYKNVPKQIGQVEDCVTRGADAILIVTTSPAGLNDAIAEARGRGTIVIDVANGVETTDIDGRVLVSYYRVGETAGKYLSEKHPTGSGKVRVLYLAGPPGAAYIVALREGFHAGVEGSDIEIVKDAFGASNKAVQMELVEDGLLTYPDIDYIVGGAPGIEAAIDVLAEKGRDDIGLFATFQTPAVWDAVKSGEALGVVSDQAVLQPRLAIDMALRILEGKDYIKDVAPDSMMVDQDSIKSIDRTTSLAPDGWQPVFNVD